MALRNMLNIYRIIYNMNRTLKKTVEVTIMTRSRGRGVGDWREQQGRGEEGRIGRERNS